MSHNGKHEYLMAIWGRYQRVGRRFKSKILDEFCAVCGYSRKYALRVLHRVLRPKRRRPGPKVKYEGEVVQVLKVIWKLSEWICSKRLKEALPIWLPYYERHHGPLSESTRRLLLKMSPATMDRVLRPARARAAGRGRSGTRAALKLKLKIPIRRGTHRAERPGLLEMDTVAHCGDHLDGDFAWTLTATDLRTQWTENRAIWNKGAAGVVHQVRDIEAQLPFALWGIDVDSGAEFLNHHLYRYCQNHQPPLALTRSRPAYKNDQAHVEQKNFTHVRLLLGYHRIEEPQLVPAMNLLYQSWNAFLNFFSPTLQLVSKRRVGTKVQRRYSRPKTPYQRVLTSPEVPPENKAKLQTRLATLDPFVLKQTIESQLQFILKHLHP
jgi:hypothetical protein